MTLNDAHACENLLAERRAASGAVGGLDGSAVGNLVGAAVDGTAVVVDLTGGLAEASSDLAGGLLEVIGGILSGILG